ncbi:PepSY domain-containing protein [Bacillus thermotolerans]|uniref:PepSY domain-containing protein n=1 Tax=Bacillus thermotolerans TaxID=1221996 RepID=UPI00059186BD|nr:PepSY domain-containing protein [Bacillus thermotolerans]KKB41472.1 hypothetical protein QY96_01990 [Bacillus thermotolerans]
MNKKRLRLITVIAIALLVVGAAAWQMAGLFASAEPLTENEAKNRIQEMYAAEVKSITQSGDQYELMIEIEKQPYKVEMAAETGDIRSLTKVESNKQAEPLKEVSETEMKERLQKSYPGKLTGLKKQAEGGHAYYYATIEHGQERTTVKADALTGKVIDSSVEPLPEAPPKEQPSSLPAREITEEEARAIALKNVSGMAEDDIDLEESNGLTYYLVEVERDDDREAVVQINAISGKVMSITWED